MSSGVSNAPLHGFRLSPQQERLWRQREVVAGPIYRAMCSVRLKGELDVVRLEAGLRAVVSRHEILRTSFQPIPYSGSGLQVIEEEPSLSLRRLDLVGLIPAERELVLEEALAELALGEAVPGLRLVRDSEREHRLLMVLPALAMDAEGLVSLVREIAVAYGGEGWEQDPLQYADLAEWQSELLESEEMEEGRRYWRSQKIADPSSFRLPLERRSAAGLFRPLALRRAVSVPEAARLSVLAGALGVSLEVLLLGCWRVLLGRLSAGEEPVVAMSFGGRALAGLSEALGLLSRFLPVGCAVEPRESLRELVVGLQKKTVELAGWQQYFSWPALLGGEVSSEPYWPLCFEWVDLSEPRCAAGVVFTAERVEVCADRFKLKLSCTMLQEGLDLALWYDAERFDKSFAERLLERFLVVLGSASAESLIGDLEILGEAERREVLCAFNVAPAVRGIDGCLHDLVSEQAARTPDRTALVSEGRSLSYGELDRRSGLLACELGSAGVRRGSRVAVCADRSLEMVIALLGVLKSGAAYVPLDPEYPQDRLKLVLEDAGVDVVVTQVGFERLAGGRRVVPLATVWGESHRRAERIAVDPGDLAYVIYTSGSTGRPKGVMIPHRAILNRLLWMQEQLPLVEADAVLLKTSFSFDASVWEIFVPLLSGARVVVARPGGQKDPSYLAEVIAREGVTVLQLVPSMLGPFLEEPKASSCTGLRRIFAGGEALPAELAVRCRVLMEGAELVNLYGPTEASIDATWWPCSGAEEGPLMPIGRPIGGMRVYLLDGDLEPVPVGTAGELYIAGPGLAWGYLGRPDLTALSFVPSPFGVEPGDRLYRTGDLARHRSDGAIEFLGRGDQQVKLRGFRIELEEIEAALVEHPGVTQAVVTVREEAPGQLRLVGYAVAVAGAEPQVSELLDLLRGRLPEYMVPSALVLLRELPRLPNGKVDRSSLPEPERPASNESRGTAPRTAVEELLASLWSGLLQVETVSREDDFFDLGGHSILGTQLVTRIREAFGVRFALRELFEAPTLEQQAARIEALRRSGTEPAAPAITARSREKALPLSFSQQRLWVLDRLEPGSAAYNLPSAVRLEGPLSVSLLKRVLGEVVRRHEVLRTSFREVAGEPVQEIAAAAGLSLPVVDLSALPQAEGVAANLAREEALRPFDLTTGPLLRASLLRLAQTEHVALLTLHHAVSDGWSSRLLIREIGTLYGAYSHGVTSPLAELVVQYADFAAWQREWLSGSVLEGQLAYWRGALDGAASVLELPTDRPRPPVWSSRGARCEVEVKVPLKAAIGRLAREESVTPFMVLLAALGVVLQRWSGQDDFLIGAPIANRTRRELEEVIGFFANTLALRVDMSGDPSFNELLRRVREVCLGGAAHQDLPFEKLVEELQPVRDLSRAPLFQTMLTFESQSSTVLEMEGLTLRPLAGPGGTAKFDLELLVWDSADGGLRGFFEYGTALFDATTVGRLAGHLTHLLAAVSDGSAAVLSALPLLPEWERAAVLWEGNDTAIARTAETFLDLFAAQAARTPSSIAARSGERSLSYAELAARTDLLAGALAAHGAGPGTVVALLLPRDLDLLSAILAVFKAGAAYLPLDPQHPPGRLRQIVSVSGASLVVSAGELLAAAGDPGNVPGNTRWLDLDALWAEVRTVAGLPRPQPSDLAYVIFTSGSTGAPKGAMLEHGGMLNHLLAKVAELGLNAEDCVAQTASQSFDISVWQLLAALLVGGRVEIFPDEVAHLPARLIAEVERAGVSILETVPSLLRLLLEDLQRLGSARPEWSRLRWMIPTGEALPPELCRDWFALFPGIPLLNAYGPTECSDDVTHHRLTAAPPAGTVRVPVGRPVPNLRLYLLDHSLGAAPLGVAGQLWVGGEGVGRGYLGDPARTAESFLPDPWSERPGGRLYRTGDLARRRPNGEIEFLRRIDLQVKVRGFRIELEEIEAVLERHPGVYAAVVAVRQEEGGSGSFLAAYLVLGNPAPSIPEIRDFLRASLPEPMVPTGYKILDSLPLTSNGKVDRRALPEPERADAGRTAGAPTTENPIAELLAAIWAELLKVEDVGPEDNFFDLGGHSLLATQVIGRIRDAFGVEIALRDLFETPTVAALSGQIERALRSGKEASAPPLVKVSRAGEDLPLSFAQQRLWFIDQLTPGGNAAYNMSVVLLLDGPLRVDGLEWALSEVMCRHESLRTRFPSVRGRARQVIAPPAAGHVSLVNLENIPEAQRQATVRDLAEREARFPFDLEGGQLLRARVLRLSANEHAVLLTLHHIVSDGWSMGVLVREIVTLYGAFVQGVASPLPALPIQYADYALWQRQWLSGDVLEQLAADSTRRLAGAPALQLPTDRPRPAAQTFRGARLGLRLSQDHSDSLVAFSRGRGATLFMTLAGAFVTLLHLHAGQDDLIVSTPVANRDRTELEGLIGLFVNTLLLRCDLGGDPSFLSLLARVRETVLETYALRELPFELLVEALRVERDLSRAPLSQVMLVLQNLPAERFEIPGLAVRSLEVHNATAKLDLLLAMAETGEGLAGVLEYNTDLFDKATAARLVGHFQTLLAGVAEDPGRSLSSLPLLSAPERHQALVEWNDTARYYPPAQSLTMLLEIQAAETPDAIAVVFEGETLTYRDLHSRSNRLAWYLRRRGVGPEVVVGLCAERSLELVVGLLGVLKAGGAYLPLDPSYPSERLAFMMADAAVPLLLCQERLLATLPAHGAEVICLDTDWEVIARESDDPPPSDLHPESLAYVIYTSGSTGRPKGVMNSHRGICNRLQWMQEAYGLGPADRVLQKTPFSFDVSVWELFWPLITGARLIVARPDGHRDSSYLVRIIAEEGITTLHFVPSMLSVFLNDSGLGACCSLRRVICSGEALSLELQERFFAALGAELHNLYGPTEAAVDVSFWACERTAGRHSVPIGRPIANLRLHVASPYGRALPIGVAGELLIGGVGLARGYLRRPALTAEKFVPDPLEAETGARVYRTGDLARHLGDGAIEFLGRIDHQVKIRGFRIELGEVEAALADHPEVRETVVVARQDLPGGNGLVAYLVPLGPQAPATSALREHLKNRLPDHMVPAFFVPLEALPLSPNGKVDRRALPSPAGYTRPEVLHVAPRTPAEEILAGIWSQVLGIAEVGVHDNFFTLGGDSILSLQVLARAGERGLGFSLPDLFRYQTIAELAARGVEDGGDATALTAPFGLVSEHDLGALPEGLEDAYPLSQLQAGMLFHMEMAPDEPAYHNVNSMRLRAPFSLEPFREAVQRVVARHPMLRTSFDLKSFSEPLQLVHPHAVLPVQADDLSHLSEKEQEEAIDRYVAAEASHPFDLSEPPMLRLRLHLRGDGTFQLTLTENHAIFDGWSLHTTLAEIFDVYLGLLRNEPAEQAPLPPWTFRDFIQLERLALASEEHKRFWHGRLAGYEILELPHRSSGEPLAGRRNRHLDTRISSSLLGSLQERARAESVPLKSVLLAVHLKVLGVISGRSDVLSGLTMHGRPEVPGGEQIRGLFLNTVPFRIDLGEGSWSELVRRTFTAEQEILPYRRYPLAALQREHGNLPLLDVSLTYVHFHVVGGLLRSQEVEVLDFRRSEGQSFTLATTFSRSVAGEGLSLQLEYNAERIDEEWVRRIAGYYERALEALAGDPTARHEDSVLLSPAELEQVRCEWNQTAADLPDECVHRLFEAQAARCPGAIAVCAEGESLTYAELSSRANRLAGALIAGGAGPETVVPLLFPRGIDLLTSILAVFKAGAACLLLDPQHPDERLRHLLLASHVGPFLLASGNLYTRAQRVTAGVGGMRCAGFEPLLAEEWPERDLPPRSTSSNLAFLIFTSGSTGNPKGVMLEQRGVVNHLFAKIGLLELSAQDAVAQTASQAFVVVIWQLLAALLVGGRVEILADAEVRDPAFLLETVRHRGITVLTLVPSMIGSILADAALPAGQGLDLPSLRRIVATGEPLPSELCRRWLARFPYVPVINAYGCTETSDDVAHHLVEVLPGGTEVSIPIGKPAPNLQLYILDPALRPLPVGTAGELWAGGAGVSRGYLNDPAGTAAAFLPDPFSPVPGARLYRTGDLVRRRADGAMTLLGRFDHQVKIRGTRIELAEVEAMLVRHPAVRQAVTKVWRDAGGDPYLAAYVVPQGEPAPSVTDLRAFLKESLVEAMVPSLFTIVAELPRTATGKIDRSALPEPSGERAGDNGRGRSSLGNQTEEILAGIWERLLQFEGVGAEDDFFQLGGHSLLAAQLVFRVREVFAVDLSMATLFSHSTLRSFAAVVDKAHRGGDGLSAGPLRPVPRTSPLPQSFAQRRLWLLDQMERGSLGYNMHRPLRLRGRLSVPALEMGLGEVVRRHEILRTTFGLHEEQPVQIVHPVKTWSLPVIDLRALPDQPREREVRRLIRQEIHTRFDLQNGPLFLFKLLRTGEEEHVALVTLHHIIGDGWTLDILMQDLSALYEAFSHGEPSALPELPIQYGDYAAWQASWLEGEVFERQLAYWRTKLAGAPSALDLPMDRPRNARRELRGGSHHLLIPAEVIVNLEALARREGATLFMVVLSAFNVVLHCGSGSEDIVVGADVSGRDRAETERMIGFFVNELVLRTDLSGDPQFDKLLERVRETCQEAYRHQDLPFVKLVEALRPERQLGRMPFFQVAVSFRHGTGKGTRMEGLTLEPMDVEEPWARMDMTLNLDRTGDGLSCWVLYDAGLFDGGTIARLFGGFRAVLEAVARQPVLRLSELREIVATVNRDLHAAEDSRLTRGRDQRLSRLRRRAPELPPAGPNQGSSPEEAS